MRLTAMHSSPLEDLDAEKQERTVFMESLELLGGGTPFDPKAANAFHSLTMDSKGLLVDVANGGYQTDLSCYLRICCCLGSMPIVISTAKKTLHWFLLETFCGCGTDAQPGSKMVAPALSLQLL